MTAKKTAKKKTVSRKATGKKATGKKATSRKKTVAKKAKPIERAKPQVKDSQSKAATTALALSPKARLILKYVASQKSPQTVAQMKAYAFNNGHKARKGWSATVTGENNGTSMVALGLLKREVVETADGRTMLAVSATREGKAVAKMIK